MNTRPLHLPEGELTFEQDGQWITSNQPQPDPRWRTTDKQGHEHRYADRIDHYPTLTVVWGEPYWCDDCRDEHQDSWYECRLCGEKITPDTRVDYSPKYIAGPAHYYWNGEPISQEKANEILAEVQRTADEAARIHSRPPVGTQVRLGEDTVTIVPTDRRVPAGQVTVMRHGTGALETVQLSELRSNRRPGLG